MSVFRPERLKHCGCAICVRRLGAPRTWLMGAGERRAKAKRDWRKEAA